MCDLILKSRPCPIAEAARKHSNPIAFIAEEKAYSYHDIHTMVGACFTKLQSQGARYGDLIVFDAMPSLDCCILMWAIARLGAAACPLNPALPSANREEIVALLQPQWTYRRVGEAERNPPLENRETTVGFASLHPSYISIVMTSGSSGTPRAAVHSLENHLRAAQAANRNMPLVPGDRWLLSLPLFHVSGLAILFRCALAGAAVAIPEQDISLEAALEQSKATHVSLVPTQLHRLLKSETGCAALSMMKGVLLGGAPASSTLIKRAFDAGVPLVCSYGMTETSAQLCATPPGAALETLLTSGYPLLPDTVRIGENDVIEVQGPTLFQGYFAGGGDLELPLTDDGWFRTGDTGYFDEAGRLHVTGRADAMFISGGENIQPEEIEAALCALPGVQRAVVVPMPHEEYGMVPAAFIEMAGNNEIDEAVLRKGLEIGLPRFKIPKRFLPWPQQAVTGIKIDRKAFAEILRHARG